LPSTGGSADRASVAAPSPAIAPTGTPRTISVGSNQTSAAASIQRRHDDPALFGSLVAQGQNLELGEALARNARSADAYVDRLCEEGRKLHDRPALPDAPTHDRDAAAFMAPLVDYEKPLDDPPGRLHLGDPLAERLKSYGVDWPRKISDGDLAGLDFGWMEQIQAFDHWSLLGAGRLRDYPVGDVMVDPIPNYLSLQMWSKLRLAAAFRRGDFAVASAQVRHLADLTRSQSILIAEMVAVAIYRLDARARDAAVANGLDPDVAGWPEPDLDQFDRHRRIAWASLYFTYPGVDPETVRKAVACMPSPCPALLEGAAVNRAFGAYDADNLDLVSDLARSHGCESAMLDRVRRTRELAAGDALAEGFESDNGIPQLFAGLHY